ncbi:MAG: fused MFS/spermidine synthase, partial [Desulfobacteraceae bacterium]
FGMLLLTAFFFSGATSLALEVAWSKELSYLMGVDIYATTTVVPAFMAGLGLGAILIARYYKWNRASIKTYGFLQLVIGTCGLISIPLLRSTMPMFSFLYDRLNYDSQLFLLIRFLFVFGLMLVPVTLMGMTLPVVVGAYFGRIKGRISYLVGLLYGTNTVGAVVGTLVAGFLLIPNIGILKTCLLTGMTDFLIGMIILWLARNKFLAPAAPQKQPPATKTTRPSRTPKESGAIRYLFDRFYSWPGLVFLLSGMVALAYEIIWFRLLARIIGPSVHAFSIMLAVYLFGIGIGSVIGSRWVKHVVNHRLAMAILLFIIGIGPLLTLLFVNDLPIWYAQLFADFSREVFTFWNLLIQGLIASLLILPATIPLGAFFPVVTRAYNREILASGHRVEQSVGRLYFYNTLGAVTGSLLTGFWLIPTAGIKTSLISAGGFNLILALIIFFISLKGAWLKKVIYCLGTAAAIVLFVANIPGLNHTILNAGLYSEMVKKNTLENKIGPAGSNLGTLLFFQEGINNSVAVVANKFNDGNLTLHLSGSWVSTTEIHGRAHLEFLGHLPMLFSRRPETVAVIGYGAGITTGNVLLYPDVKRVNIFELEPGVINASRYFEHINGRPLQDQRAHLYMVDGRSHITYEKFNYDVITSDPIHPYVAGSANLYTKDFYRIARAHLKPGGIFCQWIPLVAISPDSYNIILNTLHDVFPHIALFSFFGESVAIASGQPIQMNWRELEKRFYSPSVLRDFQLLDFQNPFNLVAFYLGGEHQIDAYLQDVAVVNTDDNVWLEHRIPMDLFDSSHGNLYFMLRSKIKDDNHKSLRQIFSGLPLEQLGIELSKLSKDGDLYYKKAEKARQDGDYTKMEEYYRQTFSDFNSKYYYPAGLKLAKYLHSQHRTGEALAITEMLQRNIPAFPDAYLLEAQIRIQTDQGRKAKEALNQGLMYNPDNPKLKEMLDKL